MSTLIDVINTKLGLTDENRVKNKTNELLRLLELRATNVPPQISEYGKIVLCADIAAGLLCTSFDKDQALKIAGLRKSHYTSYKRLFEKLLDINRIVGTKDICIQLSINGVNQKADELLALFDKVVANENADIDINHPQYAAMAVFQACKLMKQKVSKPRIMSFSNLRPIQWNMLESRWNKFILQHYVSASSNKLKGCSATDVISDKENKPEPLATKRQKPNDVEDYEQWKRRMIALAESKLKSITPSKS